MTVIRCFSSHMMTELITWRNPQGSEKNWLLLEKGNLFSSTAVIEKPWTYLGKIVSIQLSLPILAVAALVESVAYVMIATAIPIILPNEKELHAFVLYSFASSTNTLVWAVFNTFVNIPSFNKNLMTHESFQSIAGPGGFALSDHQTYVNDWLKENRPLETLENIALGASFIVEELLAGADANALEGFVSEKESIQKFILAKAIYTYAFGSKRQKDIPFFFSKYTKISIERLRYEDISSIEKELQRSIAPDIFRGPSLDAKVQKILDILEDAISAELSIDNSLFYDECWQMATDTALREVALYTQWGSDFILEDVLKKTDEETFNAFSWMEVEAIEFVLTKSIYMCAIQDKPEDPIPGFFKQTTQDAILKLREELSSSLTETARVQLLGLMSGLASFNSEEILDPSTHSIFSRLKEIGNGELQDSFFLNKCFQDTLLLKATMSFVSAKVTWLKDWRRVHQFSSGDAFYKTSALVPEQIIFYAEGEEEIPPFFMPATKDLILKLRTLQEPRDIPKLINQWVLDFQYFEHFRDRPEPLFYDFANCLKEEIGLSHPSYLVRAIEKVIENEKLLELV